MFLLRPNESKAENVGCPAHSDVQLMLLIITDISIYNKKETK